MSFSPETELPQLKILEALAAEGVEPDVIFETSDNLAHELFEDGEVGKGELLSAMAAQVYFNAMNRIVHERTGGQLAA